MSRILAILVLAFAAGPCALLRAELKFASTELLLTPRLGDSRAAGEFRFKNIGTKPVVIAKIESSCLCTTVERPEDAFAPGAEGVIPVVFKIGERQGRQQSTLVVESDDGRRQVLRLAVEVAARVSFSPRLLIFRGAEAGAKTVTLAYAAEAGVELLGVTVSAPAFEIVNEPRMEAGGVLKVSLRHVGAANADERASARVRTRDAGGAEHTDVFYLRHAPEP